MISYGKFDKREIEWIPCKNISVVWLQSQRPFNERHAKNIAADFDPEMFGTIAVTLPNGDGIYHAIDGQHRKAAAEIWAGSDQLLPCLVYECEDPARAAQLFNVMNSARKGVSPVDLFKVRVEAGIDEYVEVNKLVRGVGYYISAAQTDKSISCVAALLAIYRAHDKETLTRTLQVIQATWGMDKHAVQSTIVRGYGYFMAEFGRPGGANWQRLKERMQKTFTPGRLLGAAKARREMQGVNLALGCRNVILDIYNKGLPADKQLKSKDMHRE